MNENPCPKCHRREKLTRHHILVRKWFGSPDTAPILLICRTYHTELHKMIPENELQTIYFYWDVVFVFLQSNHVRVMEWNGRRSYIVRRRTVDTCYSQDTERNESVGRL